MINQTNVRVFVMMENIMILKQIHVKIAKCRIASFAMGQAHNASNVVKVIHLNPQVRMAMYAKKIQIF